MEKTIKIKEVENISIQDAVGSLIMHLIKKGSTQFQEGLNTPWGRIDLNCLLTLDGEEFVLDNQDDYE